MAEPYRVTQTKPYRDAWLEHGPSNRTILAWVVFWIAFCVVFAAWFIVQRL